MKEEIIKKWHEITKSTLKRGDFQKINDHLIVAKVCPWGSENGDEFFIIASEGYLEEFTIFGASKELPIAIFEALCNLANGKNASINDILETSLKELKTDPTFYFASPSYHVFPLVYKDSKKGPIPCGNNDPLRQEIDCSLTIQDGMACPLFA